MFLCEECAYLAHGKCESKYLKHISLVPKLFNLFVKLFKRTKSYLGSLKPKSTAKVYSKSLLEIEERLTELMAKLQNAIRKF